MNKIIEKLEEEIKKIIEERDEARIAVCELTTKITEEIGAETLSPRGNAKQLGWEYLYANDNEKSD